MPPVEYQDPWVAQVWSRLETLEQRQSEQERRITLADQRLERVVGVLESHTASMTALAEHVKAIDSSIGDLATLGASIVAETKRLRAMGEDLRALSPRAGSRGKEAATRPKATDPPVAGR